MKEHWKCPDCGSHVGVDEDGCCESCGADCAAFPCNCVAAARLAGARAMQEAAAKVCDAAADEADGESRTAYFSDTAALAEQRRDASISNAGVIRALVPEDVVKEADRG